MTQQVQAVPEKQPTFWQENLTQEWIEPRLVVITLIALLLSIWGENREWSEGIILLLNVTAYVAGGFFGAKTAIESLLEKEIDVDMLMVLAAIGAASIGQWHEGAILLFLFSLSNVLQDYAIGRSRNAIQSLLKLYPEEAKIKQGDTIRTVKIEAINIRDVVLIEPAERIPVDGIVLAGKSTLDESSLTGESIPVDKTVGDKVFAGTLNQYGSLDIRAISSGSNSTLSRIIQLVEQAQNSQAPTETFLDKFEQRYALFIIVSVILLIFIPPALGITDFESNFYRAMVLMTVASPCALVISVPSAFISAIASAARRGILFKGGAYLENLATVKVLAMDKTGTLTEGTPIVSTVIPYAETELTHLLAIATSLEDRSEHPLGKAIVRYAQQQGVAIETITDFEALPGLGVQGVINQKPVQIGRPDYLAKQIAIPEKLQQQLHELEHNGNTVVGIVEAGKWLGFIALADQPRAESAEVIQQLQENGYKIAMLTGDNERVAQAIARQLNIDLVYAGLMPEEKVNIVQQLQAQYGKVAMVGDGVNDAPALAVATVGIAMGGAGTDAALETADVVLMGDRLRLLHDAFSLAKKTRRVVWQNVGFSILVIVVLVLSALLFGLSLPFGVLGHEGSTVIVVLNSLFALLLFPEINRMRAK